MAARIRAAAGSPTLTARVAAAAGAGLLVGLLTRWPVAAAGAGALVLAWPSLIGGAATERLAIDRLEALALWTESLKDMIAGAVGLEQAIPVSVDAAHPLLRPRLVRLAGRLRGREPLEEALRQFAADLDDASADLIIAALILNSRLRGPGLRATLERLAASARQELDMRRKVEAGRRGIRLGVQMIVALTVGFAVLLAVFSRQYVAPYGSVVGQVILAGVLAVFAAGFAWLRRLSAEDLPDTFLARPGQLDDRVPGGGAEVPR
jgi:Flp pilus assembly protein TadB